MEEEGQEKQHLGVGSWRQEGGPRGDPEVTSGGQGGPGGGEGGKRREERGGRREVRGGNREV